MCSRRAADGQASGLAAFKSRYSLYLSTETTASFVVNAALSLWFGGEYVNSTREGAETEPFTELVFSVNVAENRIAINASASSASLTRCVLSHESRRMVVRFGASPHGDRNYTAVSELLYLHDNPEGSATKIDHVKAGLLFKIPGTGNEFVPAAVWILWAIQWV
ncbi:hypothetical protein F4678DRAFT_467250 [Xylaria arbuscula]|nr:hypothetical protein F4678DRAFT_467250 [Xylaria arbuscula]